MQNCFFLISSFYVDSFKKFSRSTQPLNQLTAEWPLCYSTKFKLNHLHLLHAVQGMKATPQSNLPPTASASIEDKASKMAEAII